MCVRHGNLGGSVDQAEDVVENKVAASTIRLELKALGIIHWLLLLVDLFANRSVSGQTGKS